MIPNSLVHCSSYCISGGTDFRKAFDPSIGQIKSIANMETMEESKEETKEEEKEEETLFKLPGHVKHTIMEKIDMCIEAERVVHAEKKMLFKAFCQSEDVQPSQLCHWTKNLVKMKAALDRTKKKATRKGTMMGRPSRLEHIGEKLMPWIDAMHASSRSILVRQCTIRAHKYDKSLCRLEQFTLFAIVRRFLDVINIVIWATTHVSQEAPCAKKEMVLAFLNTTRPLLQQSNRSLNQTPYDPRNTPNKTLAKQGEKSVTVKTGKVGVGRITACLTVTRSTNTTHNFWDE